MAGGDYEPASFDSNVWYHLTSGGKEDAYNYSDSDSYSYDTTFKNSFFENDHGHLIAGKVGTGTVWQFMPVGNGKDGRYQIRSTQHNLGKQLAVCYNDTEIDNSRTQPCMAPSDGSERQKWDITDWGDGTYRFNNVKNGSDFVLDVHPGDTATNQPFMGDDEDIKQDWQHWLMTSMRNIDDEAYQTVFAPATTTSGAPANTATPPSDDSGSGGLSAGAAAGIGVGVGLGVIIMAVVGFLLWRRRRRNRIIATATPVLSSAGGGDHDLVSKATPAPSAQTWSTSPPPPQEMAADSVRQELDSKATGSQLGQQGSGQQGSGQQGYAELEAQPIDHRGSSPR